MRNLKAAAAAGISSSAVRMRLAATSPAGHTWPHHLTAYPSDQGFPNPCALKPSHRKRHCMSSRLGSRKTEVEGSAS